MLIVSELPILGVLHLRQIWQVENTFGGGAVIVTTSPLAIVNQRFSAIWASYAKGPFRLLSITTAKSMSQVKPSNKRDAHQKSLSINIMVFRMIISYICER